MANKDNKKSVVVSIVDQLDTWIASSEEIGKILTENGMRSQAQTQNDYAQAYWNVKQFIEVNHIEGKIETKAAENYTEGKIEEKCPGVEACDKTDLACMFYSPCDDCDLKNK